MFVGHLLETKKELKKNKETADGSYIYKNELDKACFQQDMAYGDFKDITRRTAYDEVLGDKAINIAKNPIYEEYQRRLASMVYRFFDKKWEGCGVNTQANPGPRTYANGKIKQNQRSLDLAAHQLAEVLHKPIIRKF